MLAVRAAPEVEVFHEVTFYRLVHLVESVLAAVALGSRRVLPDFQYSALYFLFLECELHRSEQGLCRYGGVRAAATVATKISVAVADYQRPPVSTFIPISRIFGFG